MTFEHTEVEAHGNRGELVVLLHGFRGSPERLADLESSVRRVRPDADILAPRYRAGRFSNTDLHDLSASLDALIQDRVRERKEAGPHDPGYRRVVLIGHSIGALVVRKAYIFAMGSTEDHPVPGSKAHAKGWAGLVDRIILLSGMNRGWTVSPRPERMTVLRKGFILTWLALGRLTRTGRMLRSVERGSPFVANLRIQWVRLTWSPVRLAPVFQLLGTIDDFVSMDDHRDLSAGTNVTFIPVVGSGHDDILEFADSDDGRRRRETFEQALTRSESWLRSEYGTDTARVGERTVRRLDHVVFILHGIRDTGGWRGAVRDALRRVDGSIEVRTPGYTYLPMLPFLLLGVRQRFVRKFVDWYTETLAEYPRAKISFVGHSNGTYIAAAALARYPAVRLHHLVFAGSVVPRAYPWNRIIRVQHRATAIRNYLASADWVVAIFPRLFELVTELTGFRRLGFGDIGSAGFNGFLDDSANDGEVRYVRGGHSAALRPGNHASIADFIDRRSSSAPDERATAQHGIVALLSKLTWLVWPALLALAAAPAFWLVPWMMGAAGWSPYATGLVYAAVIFLLLCTI